MGEHEIDGGDGDEKLLSVVGLTPKEALFVRAFSDVESETFGKATASAKVAGFSEPHNASWRLRRRPRIAAAIAEMEKLVRVQVGKIISDLEFTRLAALTKGDLATAARCSELAGKHIGMFYERNVLTVDGPETARYERRRDADLRIVEALVLAGDLPALPAPPVVVEQTQAPQERQKESV